MKEGDIVRFKLNGKKAMIISDDRWRSGGNLRYPHFTVRLEDLTVKEVMECEIQSEIDWIYRKEN